MDTGAILRSKMELVRHTHHTGSHQNTIMGFFRGQAVEMSQETTTLLSNSAMLSNEDASSRTRGSRLQKGSLVIVAFVAFACGALLFQVKSDYSGEEAKIMYVELEGKHKKEKHGDDPLSACMDGKYSKRTLQRAYELPFAALFQDTKGVRKYEASSVVVVGDDAYAVCDSSWAIQKFGKQLQPFATENVELVSQVHRDPAEDSGYEALLHDDGTFFVIRESIEHGDKTYHAVIEELTLGEHDYEIGDQCPSEFEFEGDSKGLEGAIAVRDLNNELVILGLCEGNHCSETHKNDRGNGRIVAMRKVIDSRSDDNSLSCEWKTIRVIDIPSSANFKDYSAITMTDSGKVGISSQEDSQFWVGQLLGQNDAGLWDIDAIKFDSKIGRIFDFPKNDGCETIYCNIEGVHWINDDMIMAVSDKMKGKGKQDFRCFDKDQSVHVFLLPE